MNDMIFGLPEKVWGLSPNITPSPLMLYFLWAGRPMFTLRFPREKP